MANTVLYPDLVKADDEDVENRVGRWRTATAPAGVVAASTSQARHSHLQTWIARLVQIVFLANLFVITGLWAVNGNVSSVHDEAALLTSAGRITGLWAAYFLLVQVLLLARLPFLKALAGSTVWLSGTSGMDA